MRRLRVRWLAARGRALRSQVRPAIWSMLAVALSALVLSACSLAGDIQPPEGYNPTPPPQEIAETSYPLMPPNPARGQAIFNARCEPCHGEAGLGGGSQAADLPVQVPMIGNPQVARTANPVDWFNTITHGNLERFMPPFGGTLTDRQRWDVVAYLFTLSISENELSQGRRIYAILCQDCHGEGGRGDGIKAAGLPVADWGDPSRLAQYSNQDLWHIITEGKQDAGMPSFKEAIQADQRWAVSSYVRTLGFAHPSAESAGEQEQPASTAALAGEESELAAPEESLAKVRVGVTNGSGGEVPEGLVVSLTGYDNMQPAAKVSGVLDQDGEYTFEEVELPEQRVFLASVEYNDLVFYSDVLQTVEMQPGEEAQLNVTIYDTSTDTSQLVAERVHIFLEFPEPDRLQVAQLFLITNPTGKVIVADQPGEPVIEFELPEGAAGLQFADSTLGERYIATNRGFADTANIAPGTAPHQVLYVYELPYDRKQTLELKMPLTVQAAVVALPDIEGLRLTSEQLRESGQRQVEGANLHLFSASNLPAGAELELTVAGNPGTAALFRGGPANNLLLGGALFVLVLVLGLFWLRRQRQAAVLADGAGMPLEDVEPVDTLLDAIVTLDDLFRSGQLPLEAYKERRKALKDRLNIARMRENEQEGTEID